MYFTNREKLLFSVILILAIALSGTIYMNHNKASTFIAGSSEKTIEDEEEPEEEETTDTVKMIGIHIGGQVKTPGFIWMEEGKRIYDAINFVGGALPEADLDVINLSEKLWDEEKIYIPRKGETISISAVQTGNSIGATDRGGKSGKININNATESDFETLPGIGPVLAKRITEHRNSIGLFKTIDDIRGVSGIGEKRYDEIKDLITVK